MNETQEAKVARFKAFNQEMLAAAMAEANLRHQSIHAKVLLCAIIDSLAKSRFPDIKGNTKRFVQTVSNCAGWVDCERFSLLHVLRAIEVAGSPTDFADLERWAREELLIRLPPTSRLLSVRTPISKDPFPQEISVHWPCDPKTATPMKIANQKQENFQHKNLLWTYRNSLTHEFRIPGRGFERAVKDEVEPYYQQVSKIDAISVQTGLQFSNRWELVYPTRFLYGLAEHILEAVATFHLTNGTSPFAPYSEGSYWILDFNKD